MSTKITTQTKTTTRERSWLEVGLLIGDKFSATADRYPNMDRHLKVQRSYDSWANGDGRQQVANWEIEIPDDYPLNIVKVYAGKRGKTYEQIF